MELDYAAGRQHDTHIKEVGACMTEQSNIMAEPEMCFATVGAVFGDGVTLIFDGQTAATEKHYKCNTSVLFHAGDRVKIASDSGTYVVEYIVGSPGADAPIPKGGSSGQVLSKKSDSDGDVVWKNISSGSTTGKLPSGGTTGQYLKKKSNSDYDTEWSTPPSSGGSSSGSTDKLVGSGTSNSATLNSSRQLVPAASSSLYAHSLGSSASPWYNIYIGGGTMSFGTSSSKLAFFGGTAQSKLTLSTSSVNMGYSSATASNYLTIVNNIAGILKKYGLMG